MAQRVSVLRVGARRIAKLRRIVVGTQSTANQSALFWTLPGFLASNRHVHPAHLRGRAEPHAFRSHP